MADKVYYDIGESPYYFQYDGLKFYFSSLFYKEKFIKEYNNFLRNELLKVELKFKCTISCDEMILLLLYRKIEKRGFRAYKNDKQIKENYYFICELDGFSVKE